MLRQYFQCLKEKEKLSDAYMYVDFFPCQKNEVDFAKG